MVLDFLISPSQAEKEPWTLVLATFIFVSFGVLVELYLPIKGSIIIFSMVPLIPLVWNVLLKEEEEEEAAVEASKKDGRREVLFSHHVDLWEVFAFFFLGATLAYTFWFALLPVENTQALFADQLNEVNLIRGSVIQGQFLEANEKQFTFLFNHNLQVLGLMLLFSLVYGIGSIYLLLWNASIIGVVIGGKIHEMGPYGAVVGFLGLLPHGIFELSAYFLASIAGGLFSMEMMKRGFTKPALFKHIFLEAVILIILSIILLAAGAWIEASY